MIFLPSRYFCDDYLLSFTSPAQYILLEPAVQNDDRKTNSKKRAASKCDNNFEPSQKLSLVHGRLRYSMHESKDNYLVLIDVPGVQLSDVELDIVNKNEVRIQAKRKTNENIITKYDQTFVFDIKSVDLTNVNASLESGVLTLQIGKKDPVEPVTIVVTTVTGSEVVDTTTDSKKYDVLVTLDIPGVKLEDLNIKIHEHAIHVNAKRRRGQSNVTIRKAITLDETEYDVNELKALLVDGVLTISAPRAPQVETKKRSIPISFATYTAHSATENLESVDAVETLEDKKIEEQKQE